MQMPSTNVLVKVEIPPLRKTQVQFEISAEDIDIISTFMKYSIHIGSCKVSICL